jgi:hypothetical protein
MEDLAVSMAAEDQHLSAGARPDQRGGGITFEHLSRDRDVRGPTADDGDRMGEHAFGGVTRI